MQTKMKLFTKFLIFILICASAFALPYQTANFIALSDIHFDPFYTCQQSQSPCLLIQKLRQAPATQWPAILDHYDQGPVSNYGSDSNYPLLKSVLNAAQSRSAQSSPQFILILGDFLAHNYLPRYRMYSGDQTATGYQDFVKKTFGFLTKVIKERFPDTPIYPVMGNNDSYTGNYDVVPNGTFFKDLKPFFADLIGKPLQSTFPQTFTIAGYYSVTPPQIKNLRMIILNTVLFSSHPQFALEQPSQQQLQWLQEQLQQAQQQHQKVWLVLHIPPGINVYNTVTHADQTIIPFWELPYNAKFLSLTNKYADTITAILSSHVHMDGFQVIASQIPDTFISSVSPIYRNNSSFKEYQFRSIQTQLQNYQVYFLKNDQPHLGWRLEYDFNQVYQPHCHDCTLLGPMLKINPTGHLAAEYQAYYGVGDLKSQPINAGKWYPYYWCAIFHAPINKYQQCIADRLQ